MRGSATAAVFISSSITSTSNPLWIWIFRRSWRYRQWWMVHNGRCYHLSFDYFSFKVRKMFCLCRTDKLCASCKGCVNWVDVMNDRQSVCEWIAGERSVKEKSHYFEMKQAFFGKPLCCLTRPDANDIRNKTTNTNFGSKLFRSFFSSFSKRTPFMLSEFDLVVSGGSVDRRVDVLFFNFISNSCHSWSGTCCSFSCTDKRIRRR